MKYTYLEVCAGCGGLSCGLECAGLEASVLVEIDKTCIKTLKKNFKCPIILESDMRTIDFKPYKGKIDIVVGGIPCQSFSIAGKREGLANDNKGGLFYDFYRCLQEVEPAMFMIENVEGLKNINNGETLTTIISDLEKLGYTVAYKVLNATKFNVPQKRKRLIIIGTTYGVEFEYPEEHETILTMRDALKNVPISKGMEYSEKKKAVLDIVPQGGCWINLPDAIKAEYMGKSLNAGGGKRGMARRLSWDEPCLTLTTSPCQKQTERCHPDDTRPLRLREYARIQTFPDTFIFEGSTGSVYKQIGNAVPCMLAYYVGKQIIKCLNKIYLSASLKNNIENIISNMGKKYTIKDKKIMYIAFETVLEKFLKDKIMPIYEHDKCCTNIDTIKKTFDMTFNEQTEEDWKKSNILRLVDKSLNNKIGELHEELMAYADGWDRCSNSTDPKIKNNRVDLYKKDKSVFIELKNSSVTMNSAAREATISHLLAILEEFPDAIVGLGIVNDHIKCSNNRITSIKTYTIKGNTLDKKIKNTQTNIGNIVDKKINQYSGTALFKLIFGDESYLNTLQNLIPPIYKKLKTTKIKPLKQSIDINNELEKGNIVLKKECDEHTVKPKKNAKMSPEKNNKDDIKNIPEETLATKKEGKKIIVKPKINKNN